MRGIILSLCLENNKFTELSEGIFDILISHQKLEVQIIKDVQNFKLNFFHFKKSIYNINKKTSVPS